MSRKVDAHEPSFAGVPKVDCYYHNAVPSVATCGDCLKTVCATCRDEQGLCPGCRLARRIDAAGGGRERLEGGVGPAPPPPPPQAGPRRPTVGPAMPAHRPAAALATISPETRALLALGYPLWPLAALALLDPKRDVAVRRQATQAIALNFGTAGLWFALLAISHIPLLGFAAWPLIPLLFPIWLVATVCYAFKVWHGDDVRVPLISDWLDERENEAVTV